MKASAARAVATGTFKQATLNFSKAAQVMLALIWIHGIGWKGNMLSVLDCCRVSIMYFVRKHADLCINLLLHR